MKEQKHEDAQRGTDASGRDGAGRPVPGSERRQHKSPERRYTQKGGRGIPIWVTKAMEREYSDSVKDNCMRTILLMSCSVLASEFEFGNRETNGKPGRMARFVKKFNQYCGDMLQGDIDWEVLQRELAHDTGIDLPVWFR